jgi:hypothetical protein
MTKFKATMNNDDVLDILYHHWAVCVDHYPTERQRLQHALLMLLCAGTSARGGTIVEASGYHGSNEALQYRDIAVHLVPHPEDAKRVMVVMLITFRLYKGKRNAGAP